MVYLPEVAFIPAFALLCAVTVSRAEVCRSTVKDRCQEPSHEFSSDAGSLTFVTTVNGLREGQVVRHVWRKNGKQVYAAKLKLGASPAQVHSVHSIRADDAGRWTAALLGPEGKELSKVEFEVLPAAGQGSEQTAKHRLPMPVPYVPPKEEKK